MCGIYGVVNTDGRPVPAADLELLDGAMMHRGPDDNGVMADGPVAIGMRRLSIIDVVGGHQPIANETGTVHLVLNGEIYNYRELRRDLEQRGHRFRSHSDVEVVVHLYEDFGTDCIHRLNGMFALALYDQRARRVWIARDRLGIKPLFYRSDRHRVVFSSDLNGLATLTGASCSPSSLAAYLGYSYFPAPATPYEGIERLRAGEEAIVTATGMTTRRYWRVDVAPRAGITSTAARDAVRSLVEDAVSLQMVSDVPLGVFLSGGVDSSAIATLAARHTDRLRTYTIEFLDKRGDDARYAELVAKQLGSDHHVIRVTASEQQAELDRLIDVLDEPMSDTAILPTYLVSRHARADGVKVLLSGAGGDELFGGYPRHFPRVAWSPTWLASQPAAARMIAAALLRSRNAGWAARFRSPARDFAAQISGINYAFVRELIPDALYRDLLADIERRFALTNRGASSPRMLLDVQHYLPDNILSLTDKATMMASVEGRVPLLDHRLVECAVSLPESVNLKQGEPKALFRAALEGVVPDAVLSRRKEGFDVPITSWVEQHAAFLREHLVEDMAAPLAALLRVDVVARWLDGPATRRQAASSLYALYVLNRWLRARQRAVTAGARLTA